MYRSRSFNIVLFECVTCTRVSTQLNVSKGAFTYDVSKILANFTPLPLSATVSIERHPPPPPSPDDFSICQTPSISKWHKFFKEPPTLYTIMSFLIRDKRQPAIILGEYINAVVSRIVIGPLDLKQFLPKF